VALSRPGRSEAEPQAKGVLRLLQEGHFKGVADVRLRINFADQLAALESAAEQGSMREAVDTFDAVISESLLARETMPEMVPEALANFQSELSELGSAAEGAAGLSEAVEAAYAGLTSALTELLAPDVGSELPLSAEFIAEISQQAAESESLIEATNTLAGEADIALTAGEEFDASALMAALEAAYASFIEALSSTQVSHEFTPPQGNGLAFDKFLDIYKSLSSPKPPADAEEVSGSMIDQVI
ncbi:MAG: hypothetical protein KJN90_03735, partial [Gammaproteobacteria bacterium]|nr:hypothetical protein [Gammaproteobacteria bacterium]